MKLSTTLFLVKLPGDEQLHIHRDSNDWHIRQTCCGHDYGKDKDKHLAQDFYVGKTVVQQFVALGEVCPTCLVEHQVSEVRMALLNHCEVRVIKTYDACTNRSRVLATV